MARRFGLPLAGALMLVIVGTAVAAPPPGPQRYEATTTLRSAADDAVKPDRSEAYTWPASISYLVDYPADSTTPDYYVLYPGGNKRTISLSVPADDPNTVALERRTVLCDGFSAVSFRSHGTPDWSNELAEGDSVLGDASVRCGAKSESPNTYYTAVFPGPGTEEEPEDECVIGTRKADAGGQRVFEFSPRAASAGTPPTTVLGVVVDPGTPATPGCDARFFRNDWVRGKFVQQDLGTAPAPFLMTGTLTG